MESDNNNIQLATIEYTNLYSEVCDIIDRTRQQLAATFTNKIGFVSPARRYEAPTVVRPPQM